MAKPLYYVLSVVFRWAVCIWLTTNIASAQVANSGKAAVYVGPFDVTPSLEVDVEKDDNLFQSIEGQEVSSTLTLVRPSFTAVADDGVLSYNIEYQLENGTYSDTDNNDYTDQQLSANIDWRVDIRHLLEFNVSIDKSHDARTEDAVTDLNVEDLNEFTDRSLSANYTLGSEGAQGRLSIGLATSSLRYSTNLAQTSVLESDTDTIDVNFSLGFTPSTRLTFQVIDTDNRFRNNPAVDRNNLSYLIGTEWDFTGLTTGNVSFGQTENDLVNAPGQVTTTATWRASVGWQHRDYSMFTLSANRSAQNTDNNVGSFIDSTQISVDWNYQWNDQLSMNLSLGHQNNDFVDADRNDDTDTFELELSYALRRWLSISIAVGNEKRDSTDSQNNFESNTATFSLSASL